MIICVFDSFSALKARPKSEIMYECQTVVNDVDLTALTNFLSQELDETCVNTSEKSLYLPEEFNNHVEHLGLIKSTNIFSSIHMNCRSIGKNIDSATSLLSALNIQFSATWLRPGDSMCNIEGYDFIGNGRERRWSRNFHPERLRFYT